MSENGLGFEDRPRSATKAYLKERSDAFLRGVRRAPAAPLLSGKWLVGPANTGPARLARAR